MGTILVVDDRNLNREFLAMLLGYAGYRVIESRNGAEALQRVQEDPPNLVISDIVMPIMDGIEFVQRLRADVKFKHIPVIFYTATYRLSEARQLAAPWGVATVIPKPSRPQVILDAVRSTLGESADSSAEHGTSEATLAHPRHVADQKLTEDLEGVNLRLATLIELGLELAAERDPERLLDLACHAAEAIFDSRVTAIGISGDGSGRKGRFVVRGVPDKTRPRFGDLDLSTVLSDGKPLRFNDAVTAAAVLPPWHPPVGNLLLAPLKSATRNVGWLYVADRIGSEASFGEDDEQIIMTLATQLALAYENWHLYEESSAYAAQLENQIAERKRAQLALRDSEAHLRDVLDHAPIGMAVVSPTGQFLRVNHVLCKLLGRPKGQLKKLHFNQVVDSADATAPMAELYALANGDLAREGIEKRYLREDGSSGWMQLTASLLRDDEGNPLHFIAQIQDISARKSAEEEQKLAASVFANIKDGVMVTDTAPRIMMVNPAFTAITGYSAEEAVGQKPSVMCSEQTSQEFYREMWDVLLRDGHWEGEIWNRRKSGEAFLEWLVIRLIPSSEGNPARYVGVFQDITESRRRDEHIRYLAFHDPLTDLANRSLLLDRLEHAIAFARRERQNLGLMFIDLDRFKSVNDLLGHNVGDEVLKEVARRLNQCVRQSDTVARTGGDEFVILLGHAVDRADYAGRARKVVALLAPPLEFDGHTIPLGASIGIACFPSDGATVSALMKNADAAMYSAKLAGRGTYRFFDPGMSEGAARRLEMETDLRKAVMQGELELYYQPTVSLGSDAPFGVEALLRWQHPERGRILPADFIPLAEKTGIITELGDWVLEEACRQCKAWQVLGLGRIRIAVTVAAKQLQQQDLAMRIMSKTQRHGILPSDLQLKLSESAILASRETIESVLDQLHEIGVTVALDDYGSGTSTLAYLRRLPLDILRIDRSFVGKSDDDEEDAQFVRSILALGHALKLTVVAEGIETTSQADFLRSCGCRLGQGYLYAHPAPALEFEAWLHRQANTGSLRVEPFREDWRRN